MHVPPGMLHMIVAPRPPRPRPGDDDEGTGIYMVPG